jgi:hypothetical protein
MQVDHSVAYYCLRSLFLSSLILPPSTNAPVQARKQAVNTSALSLFLFSPELLYLMFSAAALVGRNLNKPHSGFKRKFTLYIKRGRRRTHANRPETGIL